MIPDLTTAQRRLSDVSSLTARRIERDSSTSQLKSPTLTNSTLSLIYPYCYLNLHIHARVQMRVRTYMSLHNSVKMFWLSLEHVFKVHTIEQLEGFYLLTWNCVIVVALLNRRLFFRMTSALEAYNFLYKGLAVEIKTVLCTLMNIYILSGVLFIHGHDTHKTRARFTDFPMEDQFQNRNYQCYHLRSIDMCEDDCLQKPEQNYDRKLQIDIFLASRVAIFPQMMLKINKVTRSYEIMFILEFNTIRFRDYRDFMLCSIPAKVNDLELNATTEKPTNKKTVAYTGGNTKINRRTNYELFYPLRVADTRLCSSGSCKLVPMDETIMFARPLLRGVLFLLLFAKVLKGWFLKNIRHIEANKS
uniref:Uncharacterized protein n=1 Tax=Glossina austeni TaxID=7395 RepID=A0A1A9V9E4_GLOAU